MLLSRDDFPTLGIPTIDIEKDSFVSTALEESDSSNKISRTSPTPEPLRAEIPIGSSNPRSKKEIVLFLSCSGVSHLFTAKTYFLSDCLTIFAKC